VAQGLRPIAQEEANELLAIKSQLEGPSAAAQGLHQWDLPFYTAIAKVSDGTDGTFLSTPPLQR